jgi:hypothetical protein
MSDYGAMTGKPTAQTLGIDLSALTWRRAGAADPGSAASGGAASGGAASGAAADSESGAMEVAMAPRSAGGTWVLVRVTGDPEGRVLVYDEHEWACFLDGVRNGEFDVIG